MSEQNKMVERTLIEEIWNRGNFAIVDQLVSPGFRGHSSSPESDALGAEGYREYYRALRTGFPDIHFTIEDQIAEGDKVVTRWTARGTHQGDYSGIPATRAVRSDRRRHHRPHRRRKDRRVLDQPGRAGPPAAAGGHPPETTVTPR